ncbi:autotransporter outer membrane beta-barrel domain-containing protein [Aliikangiella sp. IMCC44359]|uniref:autotransporter outer membrane beta-barrel domain-containing protein n=1 Tax=Aliikangiella sp. IMCC44359 TaxID=3459125 RepID=UPI00403B015B
MPSVQAIDLLFNGTDSSVLLAEPGGVYSNTYNVVVSAKPETSDTDFFNSNCSISGQLLLSSTTATTDDYQIASESFVINTTPAEASAGQTFTSTDNTFTVLADSLEETTEVVTIAMREVSVDCGNSSTARINNTQLLYVNILDASQAELNSREALNEAGQSTLVSQVQDMKTFALLSSTTRTRGLMKQINRSRQRTQTIDTSNLNLSLNGVALDCNLLPALCNYGFSSNDDSGGASGNNNVSPLGFFANGSVELGERKGETHGNIDFDSNFLSVGLDYRINNQVIVGAAVSRAATEAGAKDKTSATDYEQLGFSLFGSYYFDSQYYIDFIASFGDSEYDLQRKVTIGPTTGLASGDTDGQETNFALSTGYTFNFDNMELRLSGLLNYAEISVDGYQELATGAISVATVDKLDLEKFLSNIAADFSWNINASFGVIIPQVSLGWEHHYSKDTFDVNGGLSANTGTNNFNYTSQVQDNDYLTWMLGVSTILTNGLSAYATFEGYAGRSDLKSNTAFIGVRLEF